MNFKSLTVIIAHGGQQRSGDTGRRVPAADMTEGSCVALFRMLIAWLLRQRFSQELDSACLDRDHVQDCVLIDRRGGMRQECDARKSGTKHLHEPDNGRATSEGRIETGPSSF
jgi:hypothetical protein